MALFIDTPGHGKYVLYGYNYYLKIFLRLFLRIPRITEFHNNNSKRMNFCTMIEKGGLGFATE